MAKSSKIQMFSLHILNILPGSLYKNEELLGMKYLEIYIGGNKIKHLYSWKYWESTSAWNKKKQNPEWLHMPCYNLASLFSVQISGFDLVAANLWTILKKNYPPST